MLPSLQTFHVASIAPTKTALPLQAAASYAAGTHCRCDPPIVHRKSERDPTERVDCSLLLYGCPRRVLNVPPTPPQASTQSRGRPRQTIVTLATLGPVQPRPCGQQGHWNSCNPGTCPASVTRGSNNTNVLITTHDPCSYGPRLTDVFGASTSYGDASVRLS